MINFLAKEMISCTACFDFMLLNLTVPEELKIVYFITTSERINISINKSL
jgi:hypothetical protein